MGKLRPALAVLAASLLLLAACESEPSAGVQTKVAVAVFSTQTAVAPPTATPSPIPTATPPPTATPEPTATPQPTPTPSPTPAPPTIPQVVRALRPATVFVLVRVAGKTVSGSGFIVSPDGKIITNHHVVEGADSIRVSVGTASYPATLYADAPTDDLALLKVEATGLPAVTLGDSASLEVGQEVLAIGYPFADEIGSTEPSVTRGIVSRLGLKVEGIVDGIQIDAPLNPGNSGGPLVDLQGAVVGVNVAKLTRATGISFAIPVSRVQTLLARPPQGSAPGWRAGSPPAEDGILAGGPLVVDARAKWCYRRPYL